jgi:hypothetical protein
LRDLLRFTVGLPWAMAELGRSWIGRALSQRRRRESPVAAPGSGPASVSEWRRVDGGRLDTRRMVVLGEGLAAGMASFGLSAPSQKTSFAARVATQTGAGFSQRLIQPPGIGDAPGFPRLPVRLPGAMQTTVVEGFPDAGDPSDVSFPGCRLADALALRPAAPVVRRDDARQTAANLILGLRAFVAGAPEPHPTPLEAALACRPTFVIVCLGFQEALEALIGQDYSRSPDPETFGRSIEGLLAPLRGAGAEVLVLTVPDPLDTAHFASLDSAARTVKVERSLLQATYGLRDDDRITPAGLVEIGNHFLSQAAEPLPAGMVLLGETSHAVSARVGEWNRQVLRAASETGALVYDLGGFLRGVARNGVWAGGRTLSGEYLGGFYGLNGYYPGETGHALIANEILACLNARYGAAFPPVNLSDALRNDPVALYEPAGGPDWTWKDVPPAWPAGDAGAQPARPTDASSAALAASHFELVEPAPRRIQLPARLEQTLPLCPESSYFGEAIRPVDCSSAEEAKHGGSPAMLFNGLVLVDSHLSGHLRFRFQPPAGDLTHFEVSVGDGLTGEDSTLVAPLLYKMPFCQNRLTDAPGLVSSGDVDLATGEVHNLTFACGIRTSGLFALARTNPRFPQQPITFPGQYGSAWARFEPRADGGLDFTFFGSTFLPLGTELGGHMLRLPLPFSGPALQFASIPGRGTVMHPHVCLSTKAVDMTASGGAPDLPENTVEEYTLFPHNSSFGDQFSLNIPELGGGGTGRSHLMGRLEIQFGERSGNSIPVAITSLPPGGLLVPLASSPIAEAFPGRLIMGPFGFDEFLRFPQRTYLLEGVSFLDDPFDLAVGAVDVRTGNLLTQLLRRGFLDQDVFLALMRIEPRTPKSSFFFRGPARFESGPTGQSAFRLRGHVLVPYPVGFAFPQPDLATAYTVGPDSVLDPFLWLQAMSPGPPPSEAFAGEARDVIASIGDRFSLRYCIPGAGGGPAEFEYVNHTQEGAFRMHTLSWSSFLRSPALTGGDYDAVAFGGFGTWSKDGMTSLQQASVHVSRAPGFPFLGVQIDGGAVSNVNTKPRTRDEARP